MKFLKHAVIDERRRYYLPIQKILRVEGDIQNSSQLIGNQEIQMFCGYGGERTIIPPNGSIYVDFGMSIHGGVRIIGRAKAGKVNLRFGESVSELLGEANQDHSIINTDLAIPYMGMYEFGSTVFRFVKLTNLSENELCLVNLIAVALESDLEVTGSFECSDARLNQIWKTAIRTLHLCLQDYIYDGSKRDRLIWMGDMHPELRGIFCAYSDYSLVKKSFEYKIKDTPLDKPMNGIWTYSCWFIICLYDYYMASGDKEFLLKHKDYICHVIKQYAEFIAPDGAEIIPDWKFLDWPNEDNPKAKHAGIQALLIWMLESGAKIFEVFNEDNSYLLTQVKLLRKHIPDCDGRKAPAALQSIIKLADRRDILENNPYSGVSTFYGFYMLLAKETVPALDLIRKYWGTMLDYGATTFWEDFDLNWVKNASRIDEFPIEGKDDLHADFGNYCYKGLRHSLSHGWSCGPAPFLSERVLGVKFLEPGGSLIEVKPDLGDLEYAKGKIPCAYGLIEVEAHRNGELKINLPDGVRLKS